MPFAISHLSFEIARDLRVNRSLKIANEKWQTAYGKFPAPVISNLRNLSNLWILFYFGSSFLPAFRLSQFMIALNTSM